MAYMNNPPPKNENISTLKQRKIQQCLFDGTFCNCIQWCLVIHNIYNKHCHPTLVVCAFQGKSGECIFADSKHSVQSATWSTYVMGLPGESWMMSDSIWDNAFKHVRYNPTLFVCEFQKKLRRMITGSKHSVQSVTWVLFQLDTTRGYNTKGKRVFNEESFYSRP